MFKIFINVIILCIGNIAYSQALMVNETTGLDFGFVERPQFGSAEVEVTVSGVVGSATTAKHIDNSMVSSGSYIITGSATDMINISASNVSNISGISFRKIYASYDGGGVGDIMNAPLGILTAPGDGRILNIGALLEVSAAVPEGEYYPEFDLDINYE